MFKAHDEDRNGKLSRKEFASTFASLGYAQAYMAGTAWVARAHTFANLQTTEL